MNLLIGILPAVLWGISPIIATKIGGTPLNQMMGACYGQFVIGILVLVVLRPAVTTSDFIWCFLGGLAWPLGQLLQFKSFKTLNVSRAMPISTGLQLLMVPLAGVVFWHEWTSLSSRIIGGLSILGLIVGISLTSVHKSDAQKNMAYGQTFIILILSSLAFAIYSVFPKIPNVSGITGTFPQMMGSFTGAILISVYYQLKIHRSPLFDKLTFANISYGFFSGIGAIFYITSLKLNGAANAFPLTQLDMVISTLGGIAFLHERKNHKELVLMMFGMALIILASFMIARL